MASAVQAEKLLTAEEYGRLSDNGRRTKLVRGWIVELNIPYQRHGQILVNIARLIGRYMD
jgi:Uma2 family endonuclease